MATAFLLVVAQVLQSGVISNSVSPPPAVAPSRVQRISPMTPVTLSVRVLSGDTPILSDQLNVGRSNATTIVQRHEAPPEFCPPGSPAVQSTVTFQINREASQTPDEFFFGLTWSRAIEPCKVGGSLGQSVVKSVEVRPGKTVVVPGEGDLRIELTRP